MADAVLPVVQDLIRRALTGERVPVPGVPQLCALTASAADSALLVTVWAEGGKRAPILTLGVARDERDSLPLWRLLHESAVGSTLKTDPHQPPPVPWCAARIEAGMVLHPQPADWLGDVEGGGAGGWLDILEQ